MLGCLHGHPVTHGARGPQVGHPWSTQLFRGCSPHSTVQHLTHLSTLQPLPLSSSHSRSLPLSVETTQALLLASVSGYFHQPQEDCTFFLSFTIRLHLLPPGNHSVQLTPNVPRLSSKTSLSWGHGLSSTFIFISEFKKLLVSPLGLELRIQCTKLGFCFATSRRKTEYPWEQVLQQLEQQTIW